MAGSDRVVAVCGHEADAGRALRAILPPGVDAVAGGRALYRRVSELVREGVRVCVVPMTLGRQPGLAADAARTLRSLAPGRGARVVLAEPFATCVHLVGWLRAAARRAPADAALLITAPGGDPYEDAELARVASLVRCHGGYRVVEVSFVGGDPDPVEGLRRCRLLGAERVAVLPAAFAAPDVAAIPRAVSTGPLLSPAALAEVLAARVATAWARYDAGDAGLTGAPLADHDHGLAHSHRPGPGPDGRGGDHDHPSAHGHDHRVHRHFHPHPDPTAPVAGAAPSPPPGAEFPLPADTRSTA
ncbi:cobalamin biosynthesis protein CbiX [Embleya sp. NPDC005971]|uniref:cobalamin biosynthesis protein CbiX n=1 Tax=Embleya sp. NPDC005971 TaxID=3156724 RepID=UPI0034014064